MNRKDFALWPLILIFIGLVFLLNNLGVIDYGIGKLWPVILILVGGIMLYNNYSPDKKNKK